MSLSSQQLSNWLALWRAPGIGPVKFMTLLKCDPDLNTIFKKPNQFATRYNLNEKTLNYLQAPDWRSVEQDLQWAQQRDHHIVSCMDLHYPNRLNEIAAAPPLLFVHGNPAYLAEPQIALVGSRHPTVQGKENAKQFAHALAKKNFIITSGLALGIDAASHEGALAANGKTIAVMATGLDQIYPTMHRFLAEKISANGALISEFPLQTPPRALHFPRRNRLISGLSLGVVVVEAALNSGSLITANYANEQGREVFAIPGSLQNPLSVGCHTLIKQGAKLVSCVEDITEEFAALICHTTIQLLDSEQQKLLSYLHSEPISIDLLVEHSKFSADYVASTLLILELQGLVHCTDYGYIKL